MSTFTVRVEISPLGEHEYVFTEAMVDTGATHSAFPSDFLEGIGVQSTGTRRFRLADGTEIERPIGEARIRHMGVAAPCVVVFVAGNAGHLLGATTLENLGLIADPINERLVPKVVKERPF